MREEYKLWLGRKMNLISQLVPTVFLQLEPSKIDALFDQFNVKFCYLQILSFFQYENQVSILGNWTNRGPTMTRPKFSDATGKVELLKDHFEPPPGWNWEGDWYVSPELR